MIFAAGNFVFSGIYLVFVAFGKRHGLSPAAIGALVAVFGGASLAGALVAPRITKLLSMRSIMLGNEWLSAALLLCAIAPGPYVLLACVLPIAFFSPALNSVVIGYRTAITPDRPLRSRQQRLAKPRADRLPAGAARRRIAAGVVLGAG